jgi:uncharacterized membrane protein
MASMIDGFPRALTITAAVGAAVTGGALFVFSAFVMPGLRRLSGEDGARAMQAINKAAPTSPAFMVVFMGTAVVCAGVGVVACTRLDEPSSTYLLAGAVLYLATIAITAGYHVPRNDALSLVDPSTAAGLEAWRDYVPGWVAMNHVRAATAIGGSLSFILALGAT